MLKLKLIKVANHWYLDIPHDYNDCINFNKKIDKVFDKIDFIGFRTLTLVISESETLSDSKDKLFFNESDIYKYFTTDEYLDMRFSINNHEFSINSDLYWKLENTFNFNFHKKSYKISIY